MSTYERTIQRLTEAAHSHDIKDRLTAAKDSETRIRDLGDLYRSGDERLVNVVRGNIKWQRFRYNFKSDNPDLWSMPDEYVDNLLARLLQH